MLSELKYGLKKYMTKVSAKRIWTIPNVYISIGKGLKAYILIRYTYKYKWVHSGNWIT